MGLYGILLRNGLLEKVRKLKFDDMGSNVKVFIPSRDESNKEFHSMDLRLTDNVCSTILQSDWQRCMHLRLTKDRCADQWEFSSVSCLLTER